MVHRLATVATTQRRKDAWRGGFAYASGCHSSSFTLRVTVWFYARISFTTRPATSVKR